MEKLLATGQKVNHILDEMYIALFLAGAQEIQSRICRREEGVEITLTSDYDPSRRQRLESLARCLENARHAPALEEAYWGLVGGDAAAEESELLLTGQLLDAAQVRLLEDSVELQLFKKYE